MREFVIFTDSTCDLPEEFVVENNIEIIPLYYSMDDNLYGGEENLDYTEFYAKMREGSMPTTVASNPEVIEDKYIKYIEQDIDIMHICFSSGLSSSCSNAFMVANEMREKYENANIIVIDSLAASMGQGLIVYKAVMMKKEGKTIDEIRDYLEDNKLHFCHQFTVDDLNHLHRGGRVSKTAAVIGTMINLKPILHVDNEGKLIPIDKIRGRKKSLSKLVSNMEETMGDYDNNIIMISHADAIEDAQYVESLIRDRFGIKNIMINPICPTIGTHAGPGTIALFFMGEKR